MTERNAEVMFKTLTRKIIINVMNPVIDICNIIRTTTTVGRLLMCSSGEHKADASLSKATCVTRTNNAFERLDSETPTAKTDPTKPCWHPGLVCNCKILALRSKQVLSKWGVGWFESR